MPVVLALLVAAIVAAWAIVVRRRAELPAEVHIVDPEGAPTIDAAGAARSVQAAELRLPADAPSGSRGPTGDSSSAARWA
jgi:hypothetical protein